MQLHAVVLAPPEVVEDTLGAARGLVETRAVAPVDAPRRGLLDRVRGRSRPAAPARPAAILDAGGPGSVFVRMAKFGNVTAGDASTLAAALGAAAATWPAPSLHVSAVSTVAAGPHVEVTARLEGDVDVLRDIFHHVNEVARLERFFLDRRNFRPELVLGRLRGVEDAPLDDDVIDREVPHRGPLWSPSAITLLRTSFSGGGASYDEVARCELSAAEADQQRPRHA